MKIHRTISIEAGLPERLEQTCKVDNFSEWVEKKAYEELTWQEGGKMCMDCGSQFNSKMWYTNPKAYPAGKCPACNSINLKDRTTPVQLPLTDSEPILKV